jgi:2-polyprenyl-3-methyl-5-hydroxy-6-metoxy-1,4-benzoquinol methylase
MNKCPICEEEQIEYNAVRDLNLCRRCNHLFKNSEVPKEYYLEYQSSAFAKVTDLHVKNAMLVAKYRYKFLQEFVDTRYKHNSLLEVGCGHQYFLDIANDDGLNVEGTELSKLMIEGMPYKMNYGNPSEINDLSTYDIICAFHVIEHMNNPLKEMRVLVEHLKEDGVVIIEVPCMNFYGLSVDIKDFYEGAHTQYFNQDSLMILLKNSGLKVIHQITFWDSTTKANTLLCAIKESANQGKFMQMSLDTLTGENE